MRLIDADAFKAYLRGALEQTRRCYPDGGEWAEAVTEEFCRDIDEQPTVQPETHWIPCSERLPEKRGFYLTTTKDKAVYCDHWNEDNFDRTEMVIAWRPLPEPYQGGEE